MESTSRSVLRPPLARSEVGNGRQSTALTARTRGEFYRAFRHMQTGTTMARLILEDGSEYVGTPFGALKSTTGEVGEGKLGPVEYGITCLCNACWLCPCIQCFRLEW